MPGRRQTADDRLVGADPVEYYAGTEGNGVNDHHLAAMARPSRLGRTRSSSARSASSTKRRGSVQPPRVNGVVYFEGGPAFAYRNDPEKTQIRLCSREGWSTLGDIGHLDEDGYLYLTDRKANMIICGGVNVYPQETEDVLIGHPAGARRRRVRRAQRRPRRGGQGRRATARPERAGPDAGGGADRLLPRPHLRRSNARAASISSASLPRTPTGKLLKRQLRERYWPAQGLTPDAAALLRPAMANIPQTARAVGARRAVRRRGAALTPCRACGTRRCSSTSPTSTALKAIRFLTADDYPPLDFAGARRLAGRLQRRDRARDLRATAAALHDPGAALGHAGRRAEDRQGRRDDRLDARDAGNCARSSASPIPIT